MLRKVDLKDYGYRLSNIYEYMTRSDSRYISKLVSLETIKQVVMSIVIEIIHMMRWED